MLREWLGIEGTEDETPRDGILSSRPEWISLIIGLVIGALTAIIGGKDAAWIFTLFTLVALGGKEVDVGHFRHVSREPLYALVAALLSFFATVFFVVPHLPESGIWYGGVQPGVLFLSVFL